MKLFKKTCVLVAFATTLGSCGENHNHIHEKASNTEVLAAETQIVEYAVEGMVCAMGCAGTIQKEVADIDGVIISEVNYDAEKAHFEYDPSKTSEEAIKAKIAAIADGQYVLSDWKEKEISEEAIEETMEEAEGEESMVEVSLPSFEIPNLFTLLLNQL